MADANNKTQDQEVTIDRPDCMPVTVSVKSTKRGVIIGIRIGTGSVDFPVFGIRPGPAPGGVRALDGPDPGDGGCPC